VDPQDPEVPGGPPARVAPVGQPVGWPLLASRLPINREGTIHRDTSGGMLVALPPTLIGEVAHAVGSAGWAADDAIRPVKYIVTAENRIHRRR